MWLKYILKIAWTCDLKRLIPHSINVSKVLFIASYSIPCLINPTPRNALFICRLVRHVFYPHLTRPHTNLKVKEEIYVKPFQNNLLNLILLVTFVLHLQMWFCRSVNCGFQPFPRLMESIISKLNLSSTLNKKTKKQANLRYWSSSGMSCKICNNEIL